MSTPTYAQNELMQKRANVVEQARALVDRAKEEVRDLNAEEKEQYDRMMVDVVSLKEQADREFNLAEIEKEMATVTEKGPKLEPRGSDQLYTVTDAYATPEYRSAFNKYLFTNDPAEFRALEQGVTSEGGALVPTPLGDSIVGIAEQAMSIFGLATRVQTDSGNFDLPRVVTSGTADAGANEEANLSALSTDPAFGVYQLSVNNRKASNYIVLSKELMRDSKFDLEAWISQHGGNAIAEQDEQQYVSGAGTSGPTGFLSDANVGVTTTAAFTYGNLTTLKYGVRAGWRANGTFVMNDTVFASVIALEDSGNHLIFRPAATAGGDDVLLGSPVRTSFAMANDAVGQSPIAFGDFSQYYIVEKPLTMERSDHVLFATDQTVLKLTRSRDGRLGQDDAVHTIFRNS